jgi:hypothetical protein
MKLRWELNHEGAPICQFLQGLPSLLTGTKRERS